MQTLSRLVFCAELAMHGLFYFTSGVFVSQGITIYLCNHQIIYLFACHFARACYYFNPFVPRIIRLWNTLPPSITNNCITSLLTYKSNL